MKYGYRDYDDRELLREAWELLRDLGEKFVEIDKLRADGENIIEEMSKRK